MNPQSSTPETDAVIHDNWSGGASAVDPDFARKLERERDEARVALASALRREQDQITLRNVNIQQNAEKDAQILALREALEFIRDECDWEESPVEGENGGDRRIGEACGKALSSPAPAVVPLSKLQEAESRIASILEDTKPDCSFFDKYGACRVCGGEIPHGHAEACDVWKLEKKLQEAEADAEQLATAFKEYRGASWADFVEAGNKLDEALAAHEARKQNQTLTALKFITHDKEKSK